MLGWIPGLVEVEGVDPKLVKAKAQAFHTSSNGRTTVSASAAVIRTHAGLQDLAVAPALLLRRFLVASKRDEMEGADANDLMPGTLIRVRVQQQQQQQQSSSQDASYVLDCKLLSCITADALEAQLSTILTAARGSHASWSLGWSLTPSDPADAAASTARACSTFALLAISQQPPSSPWKSFAARSSTTCSTSCPAQAATLQQQQQQQQPCCYQGHAAHSPGQPVVVHGSPFGCLAPCHFLSSHVSGHISNVFDASSAAASDASSRMGAQLLHSTMPQHTAAAAEGAAAALVYAAAARGTAGSLFMLDARCFPGMEGGPISCSCCGGLLGLLLQPLSNSQVELPLGASWQLLQTKLLQQLQQLGISLQTACTINQGMQGISSASSVAASSRQHQLVPAAAAAGGLAALHSSCAPTGHPTCHALPAAIKQALQSAALVRSGGAWASGVVVSSSGLVLTNAHLFQEHRTAAAAARKAQQQQQQQQQQQGAWDSDSSVAATYAGVACQVRLAPGALQAAPGAAADAAAATAAASTWLPARLLHLFSGYLDLAVLQLQLPGCAALPHVGAPRSPSTAQLVQEQPRLSVGASALQLAAAQMAPPSSLAPGARVAVLGHGLFGPMTGWPASATFGAVSSLVPVRGQPSLMVTTAAVHPGASGGPVLDMQGRLVGLVTSNARHSSGATMPHLNFCITAHELAPVVAWARSGSRDAAILQRLDRNEAEGFRVWELARPVPGEQGSGGPPQAGPLHKLREIQRKVQQAQQQRAGPSGGGSSSGSGGGSAIHSRL